MPDLASPAELKILPRHCTCFGERRKQFVSAEPPAADPNGPQYKDFLSFPFMIYTNVKAKSFNLFPFSFKTITDSAFAALFDLRLSKQEAHPASLI